jgi:hypothetical protein
LDKWTKGRTDGENAKLGCNLRLKYKVIRRKNHIGGNGK